MANGHCRRRGLCLIHSFINQPVQKKRYPLFLRLNIFARFVCYTQTITEIPRQTPAARSPVRDHQGDHQHCFGVDSSSETGLMWRDLYKGSSYVLVMRDARE